MGPFSSSFSNQAIEKVENVTFKSQRDCREHTKSRWISLPLGSCESSSWSSWNLALRGCFPRSSSSGSELEAKLRSPCLTAAVVGACVFVATHADCHEFGVAIDRETHRVLRWPLEKAHLVCTVGFFHPREFSPVQSAHVRASKTTWAPKIQILDFLRMRSSSSIGDYVFSPLKNR